jgi:hypothetical protein
MCETKSELKNQPAPPEEELFGLDPEPTGTPDLEPDDEFKARQRLMDEQGAVIREQWLDQERQDLPLE